MLCRVLESCTICDVLEIENVLDVILNVCLKVFRFIKGIKGSKAASRTFLKIKFPKRALHRRTIFGSTKILSVNSSQNITIFSWYKDHCNNLKNMNNLMCYGIVPCNLKNKASKRRFFSNAIEDPILVRSVNHS